MLYQIVSQWRMILSALILLALAALSLIKGVSVLAEGSAPRQTVQAPAVGGARAVAATPATGVAAETPKPTPPPPVGATYHTVQSGETLGKIAQQYGITTAALANANGIANPNMIRVGQKLIVPAH
jgi:peptidoglycan-N-acetylglucosamine deacetylase